MAEEDSFEWVDGSPWDYEDWVNWAPDNHNDAQHCVLIYGLENPYGNEWDDESCYATYPNWICNRYDYVFHSSAPTNNPSTVPTYLPTILPTRLPSKQPTINPTDEPTHMPSEQPTDRPTAASTTISGLGPGSGESTASSNNAAVAAYFNDIGSFAVYALLVFALILVVFAFCWHECNVFGRGTDRPNIIAILKFVSNVSDLWSDVLFTIVLYLQGYLLYFGLSLGFVSVPYFFSLAIAIHQTEKWKYGHSIHDRRDSGLANWFKKYNWVIYGFTILGGFYSSIELAKSKVHFV